MISRSAVSSFLLGATVSLIATSLWNQKKRDKNDRPGSNRSSNSAVSGGGTAMKNKTKIPQELRDEQLSRHTLYFGSDGMTKLQKAKVVVVGLGGVGSHAAHMLARAGVGHLRLIDFDQVTLSSLNRHACATLADVGIPKASCLKRFCEKLCPDPRFLIAEDVVQMYTADNSEALLGDHDWDLVLDAIDDVPTKAALLAACCLKGIRVISCMGAGGKSDVTRLHISDLRTASRDPLASKLRTCLKKLLPDDSMSVLDNMDQLSVVYSSEKTVVKLADFTDEQKAQGVHQFGAVDGMRIRILPVLGTMPALMGQALAANALCQLGNKPFSPVTGERIGRNVRHKLHQHLKRRELKIQQKVELDSGILVGDLEDGKIINGVWVGPVQIDSDDVEYLLEIWRNRCGVTGDRLGHVLELVRWDLSQPSVCKNLLIMSARASAKFDEHGRDSVPKNVQQTIEARLASCRVDAYAY